MNSIFTERELVVMKDLIVVIDDETFTVDDFMVDDLLKFKTQLFLVSSGEERPISSANLKKLKQDAPGLFEQRRGLVIRERVTSGVFYALEKGKHAILWIMLAKIRLEGGTEQLRTVLNSRDATGKSIFNEMLVKKETMLSMNLPLTVVLGRAKQGDMEYTAKLLELIEQPWMREIIKRRDYTEYPCYIKRLQSPPPLKMLEKESLLDHSDHMDRSTSSDHSVLQKDSDGADSEIGSADYDEYSRHITWLQPALKILEKEPSPAHMNGSTPHYLASPKTPDSKVAEYVDRLNLAYRANTKSVWDSIKEEMLNDIVIAKITGENENIYNVYKPVLGKQWNENREGVVATLLFKAGQLLHSGSTSSAEEGAAIANTTSQDLLKSARSRSLTISMKKSSE